LKQQEIVSVPETPGRTKNSIGVCLERMETMNGTILSRRWLYLGCAVLAMTLTTGVRADDEREQGKGKEKGKEQKADIIQIDLSNLPPDLAKALRKFAMDSKTPATPVPPAKAKTPTPAKGPFTAANLPPGLAKKPITHPGRINWLKAHGYPPETPPAPPTKSKGKKGGD
jgi:hypothetical protein